MFYQQFALKSVYGVVDPPSSDALIEDILFRATPSELLRIAVGGAPKIYDENLTLYPDTPTGARAASMDAQQRLAKVKIMKKEGYVIARNKKQDEFFTASSAYDKPKFVDLTEATIYPTAQGAADATKKLWVSGSFSAKVIPINELTIEFNPVDSISTVDKSSIGDQFDDEIDLDIDDSDSDLDVDVDLDAADECPPCDTEERVDVDYEEEVESAHPQWRFRPGQPVKHAGKMVRVVAAPADSNVVTIASNVSDSKTYQKVNAATLTPVGGEEEERAGQKRAGEHEWALNAIDQATAKPRGHAWVRVMAGKDAGKRYGPFADPHRASEFKASRGFGKDAKVYTEDVEIDEALVGKDKEFQTWQGWKRACKKHFPGCTFRGDIDIGACVVDNKDVGEWDGAVGCIYGHALNESPTMPSKPPLDGTPEGNFKEKPIQHFGDQLPQFKDVEFDDPTNVSDKPATDLTTTGALPHIDKIDVPNHVKKALRYKIAEFRDCVNFNDGYDDSKASFCMTVADAFQAILDDLDVGTVESLKHAQVRWGSYMSPIRNHMPEDVQKFLSYGGRKPSLKNFFDVRWDQLRVKGPSAEDE